jgi:23S rRNA U2552 (ribose-2'-O)-methylase RlmE/FtsJ
MSKNDKLDLGLDLNRLPNDYIPIICNFTDPSDDPFKHKTDIEFSDNIDYPQFALGFHHYIHQSKDKMEITEQFKGKKQVYYVLSRFERYIDDYDNDINTISKAYFDIDPKPNILSRAFYKLWEILMMYDLVQVDKPNFVSAHLAEGPGSFIQATMFFRDMFSKKGVSKNDKYHAITLHSEELNKHVPPLEESCIKYYAKEKPERFILHKTYPKEIARMHADKDNGDLTDPKTINLFGGNFQKEKAQFITADGGFNWDNENVQEQEAFKLILAQIVTALKIQANGGHFVCKFFESFTETTAKLILILKSFYTEVHAIKPLMSRQSNSEKYFVCMNFKDKKDNVKNIAVLEWILKDALRYEKRNIVNIFPTLKFEPDFKSTLITLNTAIANRQLILINEMVDFIQKQNYRGDTYQTRRDMQIEATKFWTNLFFPEVSKFPEHKKLLEKFSKDIEAKNTESKNRLEKKLE